MTEALKQKVPVTSYVCPNTMLWQLLEFDV
jgi:hypothetical protein